MAKVTVYKFKIYDIANNDHRISRRYGTAEGIQRVRGEVLEQTAVEVEEALVGEEVEGLTLRDFNPRARPANSFQTSTRRD